MTPRSTLDQVQGSTPGQLGPGVPVPRSLVEPLQSPVTHSLVLVPHYHRPTPTSDIGPQAPGRLSDSVTLPPSDRQSWLPSDRTATRLAAVRHPCTLRRGRGERVPRSTDGKRAGSGSRGTCDPPGVHCEGGRVTPTPGSPVPHPTGAGGTRRTVKKGKGGRPKKSVGVRPGEVLRDAPHTLPVSVPLSATTVPYLSIHLL